MVSRRLTWVHARFAGDVLPAVICLVAGLLVACEPHLASAWRGEGFRWIAIFDEFNFYLRFAGHAYLFHPWSLADPSQVQGGVTHFPWLQFIPAVQIARGLNWGPVGVPAVWRLWAGVTLPLALYMTFRAWLRRPWWAAALTLLAISDLGLVVGRPLAWQALRAVEAWRRLTPEGLVPDWRFSLQQWRVITPGVSYFVLLGYVVLIWRALQSPKRQSTVLAGIALGVLFYAYFYYWTAAGVALVLFMLLQPKRWWQCVQIGAMGVGIGLPQLISSWLVKRQANPDWLPRQDYFLHLPSGEPVRISLVTVTLIVVLLFWTWRRHRDLLIVWCLVAAGWLLCRQSSFTRVEIQDGHWGYVWAPLFWLLAAVLFAREAQARVWTRARGRTAITVAVWTAVIAFFLAGVGFRHLEGTSAPESIRIRDTYRRWTEQRQANPEITLEPKAVMAGDEWYLEPAVTLNGLRPLSHMVLMFAGIDNADWHRRVALEGWLRGMSPTEFDAWQERLFSGEGMEGIMGIWPRDPEARRAALAERRADFRAVSQQPNLAMAQYEVRYFALDMNAPVPAHLAHGWTRIENGPQWRLWRRDTLSQPAASR